jgi:hypothetical protein
MQALWGVENSHLELQPKIAIFSTDMARLLT